MADGRLDLEVYEWLPDFSFSDGRVAGIPVLPRIGDLFK